MELIHGFPHFWSGRETGEFVQSQYDADYWRQRAEEARAAAQSMTYPPQSAKCISLRKPMSGSRTMQSVLRGAGEAGRHHKGCNSTAIAGQLIRLHGEEAMRIDRIQANRILAFGGFTLCFLFLLAVIVLAFA